MRSERYVVIPAVFASYQTSPPMPQWVILDSDHSRVISHATYTDKATADRDAAILNGPVPVND